MAPHPFPLPGALVLPSTSIRNATTPSPCWAPHSMTQKSPVLSNPTPREPHLSPTAMVSSTPTPPLHCASILQPLTLPHVVAFESGTISAPICLNHVPLSSCLLLLNHRDLIFEPVCASLPLALLPLLLWYKLISAFSPCLQFGPDYHNDCTITFTTG